MAELLNKDMLWDLLINVINIVILFIAARALLYKPVKKYLDARAEKLRRTQEEAAQELEQAQKKKENYTALMADTAAIRTNAVHEAQQKAAAKAQTILDKADADAEALLEETRAQAAHERAKLIEESRAELGALAVELSGKILAREVTDADNRRIIDGFFDAQEDVL